MLELVKLRKYDLEVISNWRMNPEVTKYMYTNPILTMERQLEWFKSIHDNDRVKYWVIRFDGIKIGIVNLSEIDYQNRRCSWAYYIGDTSYRGKGIASALGFNIYNYVFEIMNFNKLCCEAFAFNDKSIKLNEKFGSVIEGTLKQHINKNDQFFDIVVMGITRDRWQEIRDKYLYEKINIAE